MGEINAVDILRELVAECPENLECEHFHHAKGDRHKINDVCPPKFRYEKALELAKDFISITDLLKTCPPMTSEIIKNLKIAYKKHFFGKNDV